ncbi:MAG TPA: M14-type cytosolic carboxypeptidase [Rhodocyclaceae bacterium]|nr:M14-type cytosolic carboxypeptidase [Rhodocyclaceae bacterium]
MKISHEFDSGSIEVIRVDDPQDIRLRLREDNAAGIRQWFHFRLQDAAGKSVRLVFENAGEATYAAGWDGYRCVASYDRRNWFRIPATRYEDGELIVEHVPERNNIYYAYFEPYSHERHLDLLGWAEMSPFAQVDGLGATVQGRDVDRIVVGRSAPGRSPVWIIARQHPGETMAEWFVEGLLERLLDGADPVARRIREHAIVHVVPNMNPDGSVLGNLRTNAAGRNLNREWSDPDRAASPEVFHVRTAMESSGCELFLDIHGDEILPYVFLASSDDVPGVPETVAEQQTGFMQALLAASPDFQTEHGYENGRFREDVLKLASKWVAHRFGCLSLTLEMPFKDNARLPDGKTGWNGARSKRLGAAMLNPILQHLEGGRT